MAGRDPARVSAYDLGFVLGPRLNAAGRLTDMSVGIECLLARDGGRAAELAAQLDALNRERRDIEAGMQQTALALMERIAPADAYSLSLYDETWHQGVVGILAARLRERFNRPVIAFAPGSDGEAKGSGRSIPGLHLRDALDLVSKRHPGLILRFGGHAAAAGLTVRSADMAAFENAFEQTVRELLTPADLERVIETDGGLQAARRQPAVCRAAGRAGLGPGIRTPVILRRVRGVRTKNRRRPPPEAASAPQAGRTGVRAPSCSAARRPFPPGCTRFTVYRSTSSTACARCNWCWITGCLSSPLGRKACTFYWLAGHGTGAARVDGSRLVLVVALLFT